MAPVGQARVEVVVVDTRVVVVPTAIVALVDDGLDVDVIVGGSVDDVVDVID